MPTTVERIYRRIVITYYLSSLAPTFRNSVIVSIQRNDKLTRPYYLASKYILSGCNRVGMRITNCEPNPYLRGPYFSLHGSLAWLARRLSPPRSSPSLQRSGTRPIAVYATPHVALGTVNTTRRTDKRWVRFGKGPGRVAYATSMDQIRSRFRRPRLTAE